MLTKPIIFTGESVRAILEGRKTQTRRLVTLREFQYSKTAGYTWTFRDARGRWNDFTLADLPQSKFSPWKVGQMLWVKESFKTERVTCDSDATQDYDHECSEHCDQTYVYYKATPRIGYRPVPDKSRITYLDDNSPLNDGWHAAGWFTNGFKSPLYMPKWASRITLEVTDVRVERLQSINEKDAYDEGMTTDPVRGKVNGQPATLYPMTFAQAFMWRWDAINGKRAPWSTNPFVWVISFKKVDA